MQQVNLISLAQAAADSGVSKSQLRYFHRRGRLPGAVDVAGRILVDPGPFMEWAKTYSPRCRRKGKT